VFLKLEDNSQERKEELKKSILSLKDEIKVIKNLEVGLNFSPEERAYDVALIADFETKEDLHIYATNPTHLKLIKSLKDTNSQSKVVDYEM
jgi:hypothetical protein